MERRIARFFGGERNIGSGSLNRPDRSSSDSTHPTLYIECKSRKSFSLLTLWRDTLIKANKEKKIPLVAIHELGKQGDFLLLKKEDLQAIAALVSEGKFD